MLFSDGKVPVFQGYIVSADKLLPLKADVILAVGWVEVELVDNAS